MCYRHIRRRVLKQHTGLLSAGLGFLMAFAGVRNVLASAAALDARFGEEA